MAAANLLLGLLASASASAASASAPEEARRSTTQDPVIILFFRPRLLTYFFVFVAGTKHTRDLKFGFQGRMALPWKHAPVKLEAKAALQLLAADRPQQLVFVKDYCLNMPILSHFIIPGALPQTKDGKVILKEMTLLAEPAQELIRGVLLLLDELFETGHYLTSINDTTLMIDIATGKVLFSGYAIDHNVKLFTSPENVDSTIASMAVKLDEWIFTQNNLSASEVPEVADGLFFLMANSGNNMWYAILNNMALVPLDNRRECYIRLYEQLDVVKKANNAEYDDILQELNFPLDWHGTISRDLNDVLFSLYGGAVYDSTAATKKEKAEQITRFFRNSGVHVLERMGHAIGRSDVCLIQYAVAPLLSGSLQAALQRRDWLVSTDLHTLFVYRRLR